MSGQDVIALALENNLDIEIQRYGPLIYKQVTKRAQGGTCCAMWGGRFGRTAECEFDGCEHEQQRSGDHRGYFTGRDSYAARSVDPDA